MEKKDFEDQCRQLDKETEDVLFGDQLKNDMVVLIEEYTLRPSLDRYNYWTMHDLNQAMKFSRWCRVTNLRLMEEGHFAFIGVYDNGDKHVFHTAHYTGWIVKKDSMTCNCSVCKYFKALQEYDALLMKYVYKTDIPKNMH